MSDWLPCPLAFSFMLMAAAIGYFAGQFREQLRLLEIFKPET